MQHICYNNGIAFVPERGSGVISFVDFGGCVTVKEDALKKRADVISYLENYNLPQDGTLATNFTQKTVKPSGNSHQEDKTFEPCSVIASTYQTISYRYLFCQSEYFVVC